MTTPGPGCPAASDTSPARSSSRSVPVITARCPNEDRAVASDHATSAGSSSGRDEANSASRSACAARAAAERADTSQGTGPPASAGVSTGSVSPAAGASSTMTCALVPLIPNADTPARRGRPWAAQGTASVTSRTSPADQSTWGDGSAACRVAGSIPCRRASTILIRPATPAAAWVWPMFDLTEPSHSGRSRSCP